jgi:GT2 family glycosyltransferase
MRTFDFAAFTPTVILDIRAKRHYLNHSMPSENLGLSVIILNLDKPELIGPLTEALKREYAELKKRNFEVEVIIGDTGSTNEKTLNIYQGLPSFFRVEYGLKYHFSKNNNQLAKISKFNHLLFMNNDVIWSENNPIVDLMHHISEPTHPASVIGALMYFKENFVQHAGISLAKKEEQLFSYHPLSHKNIAPKHFKAITYMPATTGAFLCITRQAFNNLSGFDESYEAECQDVDLCLKAKQIKIPTLVKNFGPLLHLENSTRPKGESSPTDRELFSERWSTAYSKNLLGFSIDSTPYWALAPLKNLSRIRLIFHILAQKFLKIW